jgi:integrase
LSLTVAEAALKWIAHCEAEGLERGTIKQRREHRSLHIVPFIGAEKLADLTMPRIFRFLDELREADRSLAMRRKVLTNLKTMISFAQGQGWVAQNVARDVKLRSKADERKTAGPIRAGVDFPSRAELKALIDHVADRWRPFLLAAVFTGMRASELRGLTWADVDLDQGMIHVRRRADAWLDIGEPKSRSGKRDIPLPPIVINALRQWKDNCPAGDIGLAFPNGNGNVENHQNILNRFFGPLQVAAGVAVAKLDGEGKPMIDDDGEPVMLPKYGLHALRHAAASMFIAHLGWAPKKVQTVMGHSSITMTYDLYGHLFEDRDADRQAMKRIEAAVVGA